MKLFTRFEKAFNGCNYNFIFVTNKLSIYILLRWRRKHCFLIKRMSHIVHDVDVENCLQRKTDSLDEIGCKAVASDVYETLHRIANSYNIQLLFIWNGYRAVEYSAKYWARSNKCNVLYFELGNFKGKLFADPIGVNCESLAAKCPEIFTHIEYDDDSCTAWKNRYVDERRVHHTVPQARAITSVNMWYLLDIIGSATGLARADNNEKIWRKIFEKIKRNSARIKYDTYDLKKGKYIFLPLQVSNDTQLLLNSSVDNYGALNYALTHAATRKADLLVKIHPAEPNEKFIRYVCQMSKQLNFKVTNQNTFNLIENAEAIVTINSTVGLEARIFGVETHVLGRSLYGNFTNDQVKRYLCSYLLDIEYFSDVPIEISDAVKLLERSEMHCVDGK